MKNKDIKDGYAPHPYWLVDEASQWEKKDLIQGKYVIGFDPYEQESESDSYGAVQKVSDGIIEYV